ncbi:hypothetical protein FGO68_gene15879 [Halteria grandinella]|uniref:Uncharacterized protein n=1 Tax=Halteria grandinella TaxID=5974 RepID=A0A8J8NHW3_HALGN|nr:hypothetical protein FGO68_gene15879 [Halteria grandinella]
MSIILYKHLQFEGLQLMIMLGCRMQQLIDRRLSWLDNLFEALIILEQAISNPLIQFHLELMTLIKLIHIQSELFELRLCIDHIWAFSLPRSRIRALS